MKDLLERLRHDHRNSARLLGLLESDINAFVNGIDKGVRNMRSIVDYITSYTEGVHHPTEDLIYATMKKRDPSCAPLVDELNAEHKNLVLLTRELTTLLEEVILGSMMKRETVAQSGRDYIAKNREHMQKEDAVAFPFAHKILTEQDWTAISQAIPLANDPLFGPQVDQRYSALREILAAHS